VDAITALPHNHNVLRQPLLYPSLYFRVLPAAGSVSGRCRTGPHLGERLCERNFGSFEIVDRDTLRRLLDERIDTSSDQVSIGAMHRIL